MDVRFNKRLKFEDSKGDKEKIAEKLDFLDMLNLDQHLSLKQVADFYEVDCNEVKKILKECTNEFKDDNVVSTTTDTYEEFVKKYGNDFSYCEPTGKQWEVKDENTTVHLPQMSILLLPMRAVRRMGLLLTSDVANASREKMINQFIGEPCIDELFVHSVMDWCSDVMDCLEDFMNAQNEGDKELLYSSMAHLTTLHNEFDPITDSEKQEILDYIVENYKIPKSVVNAYSDDDYDDDYDEELPF